jgi:PKD repeat protein
MNVTSPAESSVFIVDETVDMVATFTDDGSNDTHTCQVTWGDGTTGDGALNASVCSATHVYTASGDYNITATVLDDDNASGSDSVFITIETAPNSPPVSNVGGPYTGDEGLAINLAGSATDSDGDTLTVTWSYTSGAGVDPGTTCTFGNPAAAATSFFCTDNGQFSLSMTVDDGHNPSVEDITSININNRPPVIALDALIGSTIFQVGEDISLSALITDPSIHDTHTCQVNWGDGTVSGGVVSNGACSASHAFSDQGEYTITITVIDDNGGSGSDSESVTVSDEQSPVPVIYLPLMTQKWGSRR